MDDKDRGPDYSKEIEEERARFADIDATWQRLVALVRQQYGDDYGPEYLEGMVVDTWNRIRGPGEQSGPSRYRKAEIPTHLRTQVYERDRYRCVSCGDYHDLTVDHIVPESKGGPTELDNLQTMCRSCNSKKGTKPG